MARGGVYFVLYPVLSVGGALRHGGGHAAAGVGLDAVDGDHHTQGGEDVGVIIHVQQIGVAPGEPLLGDGGRHIPAPLHLVLVGREVAPDLPLAAVGLQGVVGLEQRDVALELHFLLPADLNEILGHQAQDLLVDVSDLPDRPCR